MSTERDDPVRTYSLEEQARLTAQLARVTHHVHAGDLRSRPLDERMLRDFHEAIFVGVRDHAGRTRGRGWGQEHLNFGPNRSVHRNDVASELGAIFGQAERRRLALHARESSTTYELDAIRLAAWVHAEIAFTRSRMGTGERRGSARTTCW